MLPLILIPLAFGYSVLRYRLMDVELVVRRVFVYALNDARDCVADWRRRLHRRPLCLRLGARVSLPARSLCALWSRCGDGGDRDDCGAGEELFQEQIDRLFYGERYDMRNSLLDFGRTLSATTALDPLLDSLVSRLQEVMNVGRVAIFIEDEERNIGLSSWPVPQACQRRWWCRPIFAR